MGQQLDVVREMIQKKIPDKKVRNVWFLSVDIQNNILYGISGNNNHFFCRGENKPIRRYYNNTTSRN